MINFAAFCKSCGSYEIEIFTNDDEEIIFHCEKCDIKEVI